MNERIKKLIKLCTKIQRYSYESQGGGYTYTIFDKEKFAELIITECVDQCMTDDYKNILNHFRIPFEEDEELEDDCPCGHDGGTSCGSQYCFLTAPDQKESLDE